MMVEEVKLRRKYLNEGDVFILDLGLHLIQVRSGDQANSLYVGEIRTLCIITCARYSSTTLFSSLGSKEKELMLHTHCVGPAQSQ